MKQIIQKKEQLANVSLKGFIKQRKIIIKASYQRNIVKSMEGKDILFFVNHL